MAVVFAMLSSYLLSRTVVPTMVISLKEGGHDGGGEASASHKTAGTSSSAPPVRHSPPRARWLINWFVGIHEGFNRQFEKLRSFYVARLNWCLQHARIVLTALLGVVVLSLVILTPFLGEDFFPLVDAGQFRLHVSAPVGTRIEDTQHVFTQVEEVIRSVIPKDKIDLVLDNIGLPFNLNIALSDSATISASDGEILVSLNKEHHGSTWDYVKKIRQILLKKYPGCTFFTRPCNISG